MRAAGLGAVSHIIGKPNDRDQVEFWCDAKPQFSKTRAELQQVWSEVSWQIARLRDNPECADAEFARATATDDRGLSMALSFDPAEDIAAPFIASGVRPRIAILREQGVNSQTEMAAAFTRAGFVAVDVHMTDLIAGRADLSQFQGLAACGGFSYGDVLGAGGGWAKTILHHPRLAEMFAAFEARLLPGRIERWEADVAKVGETDYCRDFTSVISEGFVVHTRACPDWPKSFLSSDRCINLTRVPLGRR